MKYLILGLALAFGSGAQASTDLICLNDCLAGHPGQYTSCQSHCEKPDAQLMQFEQAPRNTKQTDLMCLSSCTGAGLSHGVCESRCSY